MMETRTNKTATSVLIGVLELGDDFSGNKTVVDLTKLFVH